MNVHVTTGKYEFTNNWFGTTADIPRWKVIFATFSPKRCLEIGSFEGRSAVFMLERLAPDGMLTCVDTWAGGADLPAEMMKDAERRFDVNTALAMESPSQLRKIKMPSHLALAKLMHSGERFDLIYIDASHTAPDVLTDAVMAFRVLADNGVMIFDDYCWTAEDRGDVLSAPGIAIDMFAAIFARSMKTISLGGQRIFQRIA